MTQSPPILTVTDAARAVIVEARSSETQPETISLFLEVNGAKNGSYSYDMWFEATADATPNDVRIEHDDLVVVVIGASIDAIQGATLDLGDGGLVMMNPNTPPVEQSSSAIPASDLSSPLEIAVLEVLEHQVNPQIAAHGGRAELVGVHESVAYLRLMGGCQGCGHAAITLTQGIITAIQAAIPEIVDVVDVTAHAEGENPYYAASAHQH